LRLQIDIRLEIDGPPLQAPPDREADAVPTPAELCKLAFAIYRARRNRDKLLYGELFGEPAWDMMLALYCLPDRGERLCVTALSYAANVALTTGLRVQEALTQRGLIEKRKVQSDGRIQIVQLTEQGRKWLESYLTSLLCSNLPAQSYLSLVRA
jgi:DNA-binding MarR family transcriptional regulator